MPFVLMAIHILKVFNWNFTTSYTNDDILNHSSHTFFPDASFVNNGLLFAGFTKIRKRFWSKFKIMSLFSVLNTDVC